MPNLEPEIAANIESVLHRGEMLLAYPPGRHGEFQDKPAKISVCVPAYNAAKNFARCLSSILSQDGVEMQVLIVDNASTDTTFAEACRLASDHDNVIAYRNPCNIGRIPNWNRCLDLAGGELLKFMMVNDYLLPDTLRLQAAAMDRYPSVVMACSALYFLQENGDTKLTPLQPMSMILPSSTAVDFALTKYNMTAGPSIQMLRRATVAERLLRFDTAYQWASDYDFAIRLLRHGDFAYLKEAGTVQDLTGERFHTVREPALNFREDAAVVRTQFWESGVLDPRTGLQKIVDRLKSDHRQYSERTRTPDEKTRLDQAFVEALTDFQRQSAEQFSKAA